MTARDDPFIAVEPFEQLKLPCHIVVQILPRGGHVGFVGWDGQARIRWAERQMIEWTIDG